MNIREMYGKTFGNWDTVYPSSGSTADIPPAIASWTALLCVVSVLAIGADETLNNGQIIDEIIGTQTVAPKVEPISRQVSLGTPVHIGRAALTSGQPHPIEA